MLGSFLDLNDNFVMRNPENPNGKTKIQTDSLVLPRILALGHDLVRRVLQNGELAVDATVGNGHDALFLATLVGDGGRVWGFDVQPEALRATKIRLSEAGLLSRFIGFEQSHAEMTMAIGADVEGKVGAVMFNLGYLPGSDKTIITQTASTRAALEQAWRLLRLGGLMTVVVYPGHPHGDEEARAVLEWFQKRPSDEADVVQYGFVNRKNPPPVLLAAQKTGWTPS